MQKMIMRRLAMLLALVFVAAACGGSNAVTDAAEDATDAAGDAADAADAATDAVDDAMGDAINVNVWVAFSDNRLDWTKERAAEFNELYPEYNVVIEGHNSYNDLFDAALLAAEQDNAPSVMHFFEAATQEVRDAVQADGSALTKPVVEALAGRSDVNGVPVVLDDVISAAAEYYTVDGAFTSVPWNTSSAIMFSNQEMLDAAGVDVPKTWGEVTAACDAIMALDDAPTNCITWPNHSWFFEQEMALQGELLASNDNGRSARADEVYIDSEGAVAYLSWWQDLNDKGYYVYTGSQRDWSGTNDAFLAQDVAMLLYSSSDTTAITGGASENGFTSTASFLPYNEEAGYHGALIGGATLWLRNGLDTAEEDGALMFMNWFSNPENAAAWHQQTGYVPITNPAVQLLTDEGFYADNPNSLIASEQLDAAEKSPATAGALIGNFVAIRDVITETSEEMLINGGDPAALLADADAKSEALLSDYNILYAE